MNGEALAEALRDVLPALVRVSTSESDRDLHAEDMTIHAPHRPDVVVYAVSTDEVARVLRLADLVPAGDG